MQQQQRIEIIFDGIEGFHATYGGASSDCDLGGMGFGNTYAEALSDCLTYLAGVCDEIDLGFDSELSCRVEALAGSEAKRLGIGIDSDSEVESMWDEIANERAVEEGVTCDAQFREEVRFFDLCDPPQLGIVVRFHGFLGDSE